MTRTREDGSPAATGIFASFGAPGFMRAWLGAAFFALGVWTERLAIGWFVLDETGSVFLAALSLGDPLDPQSRTRAGRWRRLGSGAARPRADGDGAGASGRRCPYVASRTS